jgi:DNA-binding winged helix-turn-helix (wHTH) protein
MPPAHLPPSVVRFGIFEVDLRTGELHKQGVKIKLQDQPFRILAMLLERPAELVTRQEISQRLWPAGTFVDFDHGLNNAINRLRGALRESADNPRFIETLPRKGYRFIAPIHWNGADPLALPSPPVPVQSRKSLGSHMVPAHSAIRSAIDAGDTNEEKGAALRNRSAESGQRVRSNATSAERFVFAEIRVIHDERTKTCLLDFRVSNQGGSEFTIERVGFEVLDTRTIVSSSYFVSPECSSVFGFKKFSNVYSLDIVGLTKIGDRASCNVSEVVKSGECDRFAITLIARNLGTDVYRVWRFLPTLSTSIAEVSGSQVEVWLPRRVGNTIVEQAKKPT